jgi:hypothetical protein
MVTFEGHVITGAVASTTFTGFSQLLTTPPSLTVSSTV